MPDSGHFSSAATRASCASSSATPTSRTMRVSPAINRADSIFQTASIVRCISVLVTRTDHITLVDLVAELHRQRTDRPREWSRDVHGRLVGLQGQQRVLGRDDLSGLDEDLDDCDVGEVAESGNLDVQRTVLTRGPGSAGRG